MATIGIVAARRDVPDTPTSDILTSSHGKSSLRYATATSYPTGPMRPVSPDAGAAPARLAGCGLFGLDALRMKTGWRGGL